MKQKAITTLLLLLFFQWAFPQQNSKTAIKDKQVQMVPIRDGKYKVWTKKAGNGKLKLLLLHGGPGSSAEYFFNFPEHLSKDYTIYFYAQLGTQLSDVPKDTTAYSVDLFVEDIETVRTALKLDQFYLLGHSWGNSLAQAYAAKYQKHLKGVVLCNNVNVKDEIVYEYRVEQYADIMEDFPEYKPYADSVRFGFSGKFTDFSTPESLGNQIQDKVYPEVLKRHYVRLPLPLPEDLANSKIHSNSKLMGELGFMSKTLSVDYNQYLKEIEKPVLLIGSKYDFIPPKYYVQMKETLKKSPIVDISILNGGHFVMWDDAKNFFKVLDDFIQKVEKR